jgi:hypothetical protein
MPIFEKENEVELEAGKPSLPTSLVAGLKEMIPELKKAYCMVSNNPVEGK